MPEILGPIGWADGAAATVLALQLKAALILAVAWSLQRWWQGASAAIRHGIWAVALVGAVALPVAGVVFPPITIDAPRVAAVFGDRDGPDGSEAAGRDVSVEQAAEGAGVGERVSRADAGPAEAPFAAADEPGPAAARPASTESPASVPPSGPGATDWLTLVLGLWALGAALRLAWLGVQIARARWVLGYARPEVDGRPVREADTIAARLGIRRPVRVLQTDRVGMPLTWGLIHPVVVLPEAADDWPDARLRLVLLHELAHVRRWDYLVHLLAEVACALYWPDPLAWLARRRVQAEQERACDDEVVRRGTRSVEYAEHLLEVARAFYGSRWQLGATVSLAREVSLKSRIRAILDEGISRRPLASLSGALVLAAFAAFAVPVSLARAVVAEPVEAEGRTVATGPTGSGRDVAGEPATAAAAERPFIRLEAERGVLRPPMAVREDLDALGARYIAVPDDDRGRGAEAGEGSATYSFQVDRPGEYVVWGRVMSDDDVGTVYVSVDGGAETRWRIEEADGDEIEDWRWLLMGRANRRAERIVPTRYVLDGGRHLLRLRGRDDEARIDELLVTDDPWYVPEDDDVRADGAAAYLWIEAERASLTGPMRGDVDPRASDGGFIRVRPGSAAADRGEAAFHFDVRRPGTYLVWGRVRAPGRDANSFFVSLDGRPETVWDLRTRRRRRRSGGDWTWDPVNVREVDGRRVDPLVLDLASGRHTLRLRNRETDARLDGILITDDVSYRPRGAPPITPPARPVRLWLEAEAAAISGPFAVGRDRHAVGERYLRVERGRTSRDAPPDDGTATFRFRAPAPGGYLVWARTRVDDDDEDSFWVRANGGRWIRWNGIEEDDDWEWSAVRDSDGSADVARFDLVEGGNTIEFAYREGGVRLDRVLVTNDPAFEPRGRGAPPNAVAGDADGSARR